MSTQEVADSRYTAEKLPAHLGEDPSEEALKSWFSGFGWFWLCQITNNSGNTVKFYNPYNKVNGEIAPGETESDKTQCYLPYWSYPRKYEITYYNKAFKDWKTIEIKDLEGNWWLSFYQDDIDEDIRAVSPPAIVPVCGINVTINESGYYEIYNVSLGQLNTRISFKPI